MVEYKQSAQLSKQAEQYIPGGVNTSLRRISPPLSFGPIILGHNFPEVNQRVQEVMERIDLVGVGQTDVEIELARKICEHIPSAEKVLFCNSGSEATYGAVRLARAVTGRKKLIKFQGCYHGWHDYLAMNVITPAEKLGMRDPLSAGSLDEALRATLICEFNNLEDVSRTLQQNRGEIAAIIVEPIPHNIGCVLPQPGFLEGLREMTRENGVILIFDEVVTGFRHSLGGYQKLCGVTPDLTTLGKAMANGYPIAAICGKNELMDQFNTRQGGSVFFAGTYNGHPFACAAALATIEVMEKQRVHDHVFRLGEKMRKGLKEILQLLKIKATVAGFGSIFLIYFLEGPVNNYADLLQNDQELFVSHRRKLMDRGIFQLPLNLKRNHISFSHTDEDIERTLQATGEVLATTPSVRG